MLYFVRETEVWGFRNRASGTACLWLTFAYLDGLFIILLASTCSEKYLYAPWSISEAPLIHYFPACSSWEPTDSWQDRASVDQTGPQARSLHSVQAAIGFHWLPEERDGGYVVWSAADYLQE